MNFLLYNEGFDEFYFDFVVVDCFVTIILAVSEAFLFQEWQLFDLSLLCYAEFNILFLSVSMTMQF